MKTYKVNEIFYSLQGEGVRAGTANFFVRFSDCNLRCKKETHGFDCDTEFTSGRSMTAQEILDSCRILDKTCRGVIFTGGEPALQLDEDLCRLFADEGFHTAIETNGTIELSLMSLHWITVSPKSAEHTIRCRNCKELKYVRALGQGIPETKILATYYLISPAFDSNGNSELDRKTLEWCINLVKENPTWRLSVQQHKAWRVR